MTFNEVKAAIMDLSPDDQKRLITEVIPSIWPKACLDDACLLKVRDLVDEATVKKYREENIGGI